MVLRLIVRCILPFHTAHLTTNNCHSRPTALDALAFAYLHCLLGGADSVRVAASRRANLVAWERRVESLVQASYNTASP